MPVSSIQTRFFKIDNTVLRSPGIGGCRRPGFSKEIDVKRKTMMFIILGFFFLGAVTAELDSGEVDRPAPDFSLETISGNGTIALKDLRGKAVLIDFWASWCAPCKKALPELAGLQSEFSGLRVLAISIDDRKENALKFLKRHNIDLTVLFDRKKEVAEKYNVLEMPTALLIDRKGNIHQIYAGYTADDMDTMRRDIQQLISAGS